MTKPGGTLNSVLHDMCIIMLAQHSGQNATAGSQTVTAALLSEFALTQVQYLMEET